MKPTILGSLNLDKIADKLRKVDRFILDVMGIRLADGGLSDAVAEAKRKESKEGVYNKRRHETENQRIELMKKWARENRIDPNFAASLMYQMIAESCLVQDRLMVEKFLEKVENIDEKNATVVENFLRGELLSLTAAVADSYDEEYAQEFFASKLYFNFEIQVLSRLISTIKDRSLAIDLGCATGIISFLLSPSFKKVTGYDISPDMLN